MLNPRVQLIIDMSKFCHTGLNLGIDWLDKEASLKHIVLIITVQKSLLLAVLAAPPMGLNFGIDWLDKEASLKHIVSLLLAVLAAPPKILIAPRFLRLRNRMEA